MKPSNELFDLIKSMTKSEKRFFKLSSSLQQGNKNYMKVFDFIFAQKEFDEEALKVEFAGERFIKHLPSEKNHLYRLIMKALRAYHADNTISSRLKEEIKNIEILYKKALFLECDKVLMKAKRLAIEHEKFYYLFELLNWEKILLEEAYESGEFGKDIDALIREEQEVIEKLRNLAAYHVLYSKINYVFRSGGYVRNEADRALVEEISHHPLILGRNTALSFRAATICYYIQGFCAKANVDNKTALMKFTKVKDILDQNPAICSDLTQRYMRTLSNILSLQTELDLIVEAENMIHFMREMSHHSNFRSDDIAALTFRSTYLAELKLYAKKGDFNKALETVEHIIAVMGTKNARIHKEHELHFLNAIAATYFGAGRNKEALQWLNRVLNDNENNLRQDVYGYARIFNLVVHYELGNYDLLEYIIKSTYRYLSKRQRDHDPEMTILNYIKLLARASKSGDSRAVFIEFAEELNTCLTHDSSRIILSHFDYPLWIQSKIEGITLVEAAQRKYKAYLQAEAI